MGCCCFLCVIYVQLLNQPESTSFELTSQRVCRLMSTWYPQMAKRFPIFSTMVVAYPIFITHVRASEFRLGLFKWSKHTIIIVVNTAVVITMISVVRDYEFFLLFFFFFFLLLFLFLYIIIIVSLLLSVLLILYCLLLLVILRL